MVIMTTTEGISGRLASRIVGFIELLIAFLLIGIFGWYLSVNMYKLADCSTCTLEATGFGLYVTSNLIIAVALILSTFAIFKLHNRKWIAVVWCTYDMVSFIGSVVLICVHQAFEHNAEYFLVMVIFLLKWATFFCVVCTYVWGLSEKIQDNKMNTMPVSPIRMGERRPTGGLWLLQGRRDKDVGKMKISTKL